MTIVPTAINGKVPEAFLAVLPGLDGDGTPHQADRLATESYARLRRDMHAAGLGDLTPTPGYSCYRTLADQTRMRALGLTTVPVGKSIHGEAKAVDFESVPFGSTRHQWLRANAGRYGWYQPGWAQQNGSLPESWHWEYDATRDTHPAPPVTPPPAQEDDMTPEQAAQLDYVFRQSQSTYAFLTEVPVRSAHEVASTMVSRVEGAPTTWLGDDVAGTTAALTAVQLLDQVLTRIAALEAVLTPPTSEDSL